MDSFKVPKLHGTKFNAGTDAYAFAILAFKSITRLHPFGGITTPDMDLLERMKKGLSVLNPKVKVIIPRIIDPWEYMYPGFLEDLGRIYDAGIRTVITTPLDTFLGKLIRCAKHHDDYYSGYDKCPVCYKAELKPEKPVKTTAGGIKVIKIFSDLTCIEILSEDTYINDKGSIIHIPSGKATPVLFGHKLYYLGTIPIDSSSDNISMGATVLPKLHNSHIAVRDNNTFYYITPGLKLTKNTYTPEGIASKVLTNVTINHLFEVTDSGHFIVINLADHKTIIEHDGYFIELDEVIKPVNYGLHYDEIAHRWLFIYEDAAGNFVTYVFEGTYLSYQNRTNKYAVPLDSLTINRNTIYTAHQDVIRGFSRKKNEYKDFDAPDVEEGATLKFRKGKMLVLNQTSIYEAG
jgi:hypothetical protein